MRKVFCTAVGLAAGLLACVGTAQADPANIGKVIITEIFANPDGNDNLEYIEIFNTTDQPIDISGWYVDDEDPTASEPFPPGTILGPRQALVIIGANFGLRPDDPANPGLYLPATPIWTPALLEQAFGPGSASRFLIVPGNITIANTATVFNEVPFIVDADGTVVDVANYEDGTNGWPAITSGRSFVLRPQFLNSVDNDRGCAWQLASNDPASVTSALVNFVFNNVTTTLSQATNICSPGVVNQTVPTGTDCNNNGIPDAVETCGATATAQDCNRNLIPDSCEPDVNGNGRPDDCDILQDRETTDRNMNNVLDSTDINLAGGSNGRGGPLDVNSNGILDAAEDAGRVIITEILVDPFAGGTSGGLSANLEWVEIQNVSNVPVDISGYRLVDLETGGDGYTGPVPAGTVLNPGQIAVLASLPNFPTSQGGPVYTFQQAVALYQSLWGETTAGGQSIRWIPLPRWGARATNATPNAEILTLVKGAVINDAIVPATQTSTSGPHPTRLNGPGTIGAWVTDRGYIMDQANYSNVNSNGEPLAGWPGSDSHSSFALLPAGLSLTSNNDGANWRMSIGGLNAAVQSRIPSPAPFGMTNLGEDFGSPGVVATTTQQPSGEVIITEIAASTNSIYPGSNPAPTPPQTVAGGRDEWVEILNTTSAALDLSGWYLQDEDGRTAGFAEGTVLQPGQAAVIIGGDTFAPTGGNNQPGLAPLTGRDFAQEFRDAWGCGYPIVTVADWYTNLGVFGLDRLADTPSLTNEVLRLMKADGTVADIANYDDDNTPTRIALFPFGWPGDAPAAATTFWSIYVLPGNYTQAGNDLGVNWAAALEGFEGGRTSAANPAANGSGFPTGIFNRPLFGSPGFVDGVTGPGVIQPPSTCTPTCLADITGIGGPPATRDGLLTGDDFNAFIAAFAAGDTLADIVGIGGQPPRDNLVTGDDFNAFIGSFAAGCP